jgi:hypothetical protein
MGANATIQAGMRADDMLARGDLDSVLMWKWIVSAVDELQRQLRRQDEPIN